MEPIIVGSDFYLSYLGAADSATGLPLNNGAVAYVLYDAAGVPVPGGSGTLAYVASSAGDYRGTIESTITATLIPGAFYYVLYTFAGGAFDDARREDFEARAPGEVVIDAQTWQAISGVAVTAALRAALARTCAAVREALIRRCYPNLLEPQTLTRFPFDAPPTDALLLPRPIRAVTALYVRYGANGDANLLTAADLLTPNVDYYSRPTDVLTGWNRSGIVLRRGGSRLWGIEYRYPPGVLAPVVEPNRGAVFVSGAFGPAAVSAAVQEAAARAVTLLFNSREQGGLAQSQSWNGGSFSMAQAAVADGALNSSDVLGLLRAGGVLPVHFA